MLHTRNRTRTWRFAGLTAGVTAIALAVWIGLELQHLRSSVTMTSFAASDLADSSFAFVCSLVGPSLPYVSAALIPSALVVMAPCLLQMSIVLVTAVTGATVSADAETARPLWRQSIAFAAGFLGLYLLAALAIGLLGQFVAAYAVALKTIGGALILLLGLAVLRVLPSNALSGCRGPRWLIMTGKASLRKPFSAGVAFAIYCVGCCGPYLSGLALLGAGAGSAWQGAALVLGFGLLMGLLLLLPIIAFPQSRRLGQALAQRATLFSALSGTALVVIGTALVLQPALVWVLVQLG
jgi:cytochrome c biogenesis protein CcdA